MLVCVNPIVSALVNPVLFLSAVLLFTLVCMHRRVSSVSDDDMCGGASCSAFIMFVATL